MKARIPAEALALTLVDEFARCGITHAVIAPGSRSAPLALAIADHPSIEHHVVLDERSASFRALGTAKATGRPALVVCTSGTAAAELTPAVHEAHHWRVPLIVLTADRPPELRGTGANQTIDQVKLFGEAVGWFFDLGVPEGAIDASPDAYWRSVACQAVARSLDSPPGPVHLNVPLREPLIATDEAPLDVDLGGRADGRQWVEVIAPPRKADDETIGELSQMVAGRRGVVVAGSTPGPVPGAAALARALGWPLLADPLSSTVDPEVSIATFDALLRSTRFVDAHRSEVVIRVGALGISKPLAAYVRTAEVQVLIDPYGAWLDADRSTTHIVAAEPGDLCDRLAGRVQPCDAGWIASWSAADGLARKVIDGLLDEELSEPQVARMLTRHAPPGSHLVVGASMPFRDIGAFAAPRPDLRFHANRGANGIDGCVSTAVGVASVVGAPVYALFGDLTFLHDQNGLLGLGSLEVDLTFVVLNNSGGGIFEFLPQAGIERFEELFATPQAVDLGALAALHGLEHLRVESTEGLIAAFKPSGRARVIEVVTDRVANVALHRRIERAVVEAVAGLRPDAS